MAIDIDKLRVYRIIQYKIWSMIFNRDCIAKMLVKQLRDMSIGSKEIIGRRDSVRVKCYPDTVVNDYIPFYFSVRTPMLYNIITGGGTDKFPQQDIIYLCYRLSELATDTFQWCYTDGNAAVAITRFFSKADNIDKDIDWRSIKTTDFKHANADGDHDRIRKKHAEFLVKNHVPSEYITAIVVLNEQKKADVEAILERLGKAINVYVNPKNTFYFL